MKKPVQWPLTGWLIHSVDSGREWGYEI